MRTFPLLIAFLAALVCQCISTSPLLLSNIEPEVPRVVQPKVQVQLNLATRMAQNTASRINSNIYANRHQGLTQKLQTDLSTAEANARPRMSQTQQNALANKQNAVNSLRQEERFDTAAIKVDRNGEVHVAGNVKARIEPFEKKQFGTTNFGLKPKDELTIVDTLRKDPVFNNRKIHITETVRQATTNQENSGPHAEMKLIKNGGDQSSSNGNGRRQSIVAASKPACENCHKELAQRNIPHNHVDGLAGDRITHWDKPQNIGGLRTTSYDQASGRRNSLPLSPSSSSINIRPAQPRRDSISTYPVPQTLNHDIKPMHYTLKTKPNFSSSLSTRMNARKNTPGVNKAMNRNGRRA